MIILGINAYHGDVSAALLRNDSAIEALESLSESLRAAGAERKSTELDHALAAIRESQAPKAPVGFRR